MEHIARMRRKNEVSKAMVISSWLSVEFVNYK